MITALEAIHSLNKDLIFHLSLDGVVTLANIDGQENKGVIPSEDEIQAEIIRLQTEYDSQEYSRNRRDAYPEMSDQLDKIYHEGIDAWKADMIKPIKDKYPKE
jgi:hypothetical protein